MPFVKRDATVPPTPAGQAEDDVASPIAGLRSVDADSRWQAARGLGGRAGAVPALAAALVQEQVPRVREAIVTALMRIGDQASVLALLPYLRSQDAAQRAASIEALQAMPEAIAPFLEALLGDGDCDVRILATEFARNMPQAEANRVLCLLLEREPDPNVCAAAIDVLAEVGTPAAFPALQICAERFAGTPFLPFAVSAAIAQISAGKD